jgi:flagellar biogenesis protein FliO
MSSDSEFAQLAVGFTIILFWIWLVLQIGDFVNATEKQANALERIATVLEAKP